ncbi:hypothetical protein IAT40_002150 [Kwoniella sp. CBS 6097]
MTGLPAYNELVEPGITADCIAERLHCLAPTTAFRTKYQYCNIASAILIQIIEHLSNRSYAEYVIEEIFKPVGMKFTSFKPDDKLSMGHFRVIRADGQEKEMMNLEFTFSKCPGVEAAGGVLTVGRDLAIPNFPLFVTASSPAVTEGVPYPIHPPTTPSYGLYKAQASYYHLKTIEHTGNTNSHSSLILFCPELNVKFGVMVNAGEHENGRAFTSCIRATLLDRFAGFEPKDWLSELRDVAIKEQRKIAADFGAIEGDNCLPPLIGTFKCPGFATWEFSDSNNVSVRPDLTSMPGGFEKLYGSTKVLVTAVRGEQFGEEGQGWYAGCFQLTFDGGVNHGRIMHGCPLKAQLIENSKKLVVFGLSGDQGVPPVVFTRSNEEDC